MLHTLTTFYLSLSHNRYQSRPGVHGCLVSVPYRPRGAWVLLMSVPTGRSTQPPASPERLCRTLEDWSGCRISSWVLAVCVLIPKKSMPFAVMKTQNTFLCFQKFYRLLLMGTLDVLHCHLYGFILQFIWIVAGRLPRWLNGKESICNAQAMQV